MNEKKKIEPQRMSTFRKIQSFRQSPREFPRVAGRVASSSNIEVRLMILVKHENFGWVTATVRAGLMWGFEPDIPVWMGLLHLEALLGSVRYP